MKMQSVINGREIRVEMSPQHLVPGTDATILARPLVYIDGVQVQADVFRDEEGNWIAWYLSSEVAEYVIDAVYAFCRRAGKVS